MSLKRRLLHNHTQPTESEAKRLNHPGEKWFTVEVHPPQKEITTGLENFIQSLLEIQTKWFKTRNVSPTIAYEIRRPRPDHLRFQYAVPTKRLERKVRTQLSTELPRIEFSEGVDGLPVTSEDSIGGGTLNTGFESWHPLRTDFDRPPTNGIAAALHRHAMQDTKFVIQILAKPVGGHSLQNWLWRKQAYHHRNYLRKEKEKLWGSTSPTKRERRQAHLIDNKASQSRYKTSIRFAIIGADEYTPSRVMELAGSFNRFENPVSNQYFDAVTIEKLQQNRILHFAKSVADRQLNAWSPQFRTTSEELAGLLAVPDLNQENIRNQRQ